MSTRLITKLPEDAGTYRKKLTVQAYLSQDGVTYHKSWGNQEMKGPHMVMVGPSPDEGFDVYGCEIGRFHDMYESLGDNEYIKTETVEAVKMEESFNLATVVDGQIEVQASGVAGDYAVQQPGGELQVIKEDEFENMFEDVSPRTAPLPIPTSTFTF
jgi:hypothetical protein